MCVVLVGPVYGRVFSRPWEASQIAEKIDARRSAEQMESATCFFLRFVGLRREIEWFVSDICRPLPSSSLHVAPTILVEDGGHRF